MGDHAAIESSDIYPEEKRIEELNSAFTTVTKLVIDDYYKKMDEILSFHRGKLLEKEILVLIGKIITSSTLAMFYSVKDYLPEAPIDYEVLGQTICRNLRKSFSQITKSSDAVTKKTQSKKKK